MSEAGFTMIPNRVLHDRSLSLAARALYAVLRDLAWQETGEAKGDVYEIRFELTEKEIAKEAGCSVGALRRRACELDSAGLVKRERPNRRQTLVWTIRRSPSQSETVGLSQSETEGLSPTETTQPRARSSSRSKTYNQKTDDFVVDDGPIEVLDEDGQPVEAVIEGNTLDTLIGDFGATPKQRALFEAAYHENPDGFARLVADVRRNGRKPVAVLTTAVRSGAHLAPRGGGLTPEEIEQFGSAL